MKEEVIKWDGFDGCIIGRCMNSGRLIYDSEKMILTMMNNHKMGYEEAMEYLDYNTFNCFLTDDEGDLISPIHLTTYEDFYGTEEVKSTVNIGRQLEINFDE